MPVRSNLPTAVIASLGLVVGYLVADLTGVRAVGGAVLLAALAFCGWRWRQQVGLARTVVLVGIYLALFAASHLLALVIGAWPSVLVVAAVMFLAAGVLANPASPADHARPVGGTSPARDVQVRAD